MSQPYFPIYGVGILSLTPTGATPTAARIAVLSDIKVSQKIDFETLYGEEMDPIDVAAKQRSTTITAKCSSFASDVYAALMGVSTAAGQEIQIQDEAVTVPGVSTYTVTVAHGANFATNIGVINLTTGLTMLRDSAAAANKYSVNTTTGVYTFDSSAASQSLLVSYTYKDAVNGKTVAIPAQLAGAGNTFSLDVWRTYGSNTWGHRFPAVRGGGIDYSLGKQKHAEVDLSFQAFKDPTTNTLCTAFFTK